MTSKNKTYPDLFTRNHDTNYAYEKNRYKKH